MRRKLFFWLEKLKITRQERIAIVTLVLVLVILSFLNILIEPGTAANSKHYQAVEQEFMERKAAIQEQENELMARYDPQHKGADKSTSNNMVASPRDTNSRSSEADTMEKEKSPKINVNTAGIEKLQQLKGIGPVYAKRIVAYRDTAGEFKTARELIKIKGIGEKRLENIRPKIEL